MPRAANRGRVMEHDDLEAFVAALADPLAEALAPRLAELVGERLGLTPDGAPVRYVDAAQIARLFGVERDWVYAHKESLGGIRLPGGRGARGRLRFDLRRVAAALEDDAAAKPRPPRPPRRRAAGRPASDPDLIPYDEAA